MTEIPTFQCKEGCHDCCGMVPFSKDEWQRISLKAAELGVIPREILSSTDDTIFVPDIKLEETCPFMENDGCSIYENRPFMCRLFGATEVSHLICPRGCKPETPLTESQTDVLMEERIMGYE